MQVVKNDVVRIGREVVETMQMGEKRVPTDGLVTVVSDPDSDGRVVVRWTGDSLWVNQDWLHPYETPVETVTLRLDAETLEALRSDFYYASDDSLRSFLRGLDVN